MKQSMALGFLFERTTRMIKLRFHQLFKELGFNITPEQWVILDILHKNGNLTQKEIADKSFKDAPSISRILSGLYNRNYIAKSTLDVDKRFSSICLTEKGQEVVDCLLPHVENLREIGSENLEEKDLSALIEYMNQVFTNYNKQEVKN